jgi:hypothetical protein
MMHHMRKPFITLTFALLSFAVTSCSSCKPGKPGPIGKYNVEVTLDESLAKNAVLVDIVGVNGSTLPRYQSYPMEKYFGPNDALRHDSPKIVMNFVSGKSLTNSLSATDPQWDKWKAIGVTHLMVLADLPPAGVVSREGVADPRRMLLPLDECNWPSKTKNLSVVVQRSGVITVTPTRFPK